MVNSFTVLIVPCGIEILKKMTVYEAIDVLIVPCGIEIGNDGRLSVLVPLVLIVPCGIEIAVTYSLIREHPVS